jgi:hypothetical protein
MGKEPLAKAHKQRSIIYHREKGKKKCLTREGKTAGTPQGIDGIFRVGPLCLGRRSFAQKQKLWLVLVASRIPGGRAAGSTCDIAPVWIDV